MISSGSGSRAVIRPPAISAARVPGAATSSCTRATLPTRRPRPAPSARCSRNARGPQERVIRTARFGGCLREQSFHLPGAAVRSGGAAGLRRAPRGEAREDKHMTATGGSGISRPRFGSFPDWRRQAVVVGSHGATRPATEGDTMAAQERQGSGIHQALEVWGRRRWVGIVLFLGASVPALSFVASLPDIYKATATVLVERQQIPETFVRPAVSDELETRLHAISEEVLSRSRLNDLVARYEPYPALRGKVSPEALIERMRRDINLDLKGVERTWERGATVAFALSYRGRDPRKVAQITNALASLYVEQNEKSREQQATHTADFLKNQMDEMKRKLEEQEARVGQFRKRHAGELPQQVESNIAVLERLNVQLQLNSEKQMRAMDRRDRLSGQAADAGSGAPAGDPEDTQARIDRLMEERAELCRHYTDSYPDVARLDREIADLKRRLAEAPATPRTGGATGPQTLGGSRPAESEIATLKREEERLRRTIAAYEQRIDVAPQRQQEFEARSRDYHTTKELYDSLLKRYEESLVAASMEHGQTGEQFRILDAALPPRDPAAPNRLWLSLMTLILSAGVAVGAMAVAEQLDTSFHSVESLREFTRVPVLARIPRIVTRRDMFRKVVTVGVAVVLLAAGLAASAAVSYYVAHEYEQMVFILSGGRL